ncbi:DNA helicase [Brucellaceae bacterium D45D]
MKLSAPIYQLKRQAKRLSRDEHLPLHAALNQFAKREGFENWSLLSFRAGEQAISVSELHRKLEPGDLILVGARPGHGKTLLSLNLLIEAMRQGKRGLFFSLEYSLKDIAARFKLLNVEMEHYKGLFSFDSSDDICADYIIEKLMFQPRGSFAVVDYLQILDQKRDKPELMLQINALKNFASRNAMTILCISQIDRAYDGDTKSCPDLIDVRLPNPLDLTLFNKACFLHNGEIRLRALS